MRFQFRGVHYDSQPATLDVTEAEVGGLYRGSPWKVHRLKQPLQRAGGKEMTYRGVTYHK